MLYVRGNQDDYDNWVKNGNPGWDSKAVWKYFKKSENNTYKPFIGEYHSNQGPLKVSFSTEWPTHSQHFFDAYAERGIPYVEDYNGNEHICSTNLQGTFAKGRRSSTAEAFLAYIRDRLNLHVITNGFVEKVLIDVNNRARGAKYTYNGETRVAYASKEVIVSAGVVLSPVVLMHSGIGPSSQLSKFNIPQKVGLPVGENLIDHICAFGFFTFDPTQSPPSNPLDSLYNWAMHGNGGFTSIVQVGAFYNSQNQSSTRPNIQLTYVHIASNSSDIALVGALGVKQEYIDFLANVSKTKDIGFLVIINLHPTSRGYVRLNGKSPSDYPEINPKYLDSGEDLDVLVNALNQQQNLVNTEAFCERGGEVLRMPLPDCNGFPYRSRRYQECYIKHFSTHAYHLIGTNKMGPKGDASTVVDERLRVHNVSNLRVIDASIMPQPVSGNTNAPTMMFGEKGADMIKEDHAIFV